MIKGRSLGMTTMAAALERYYKDILDVNESSNRRKLNRHNRKTIPLLRGSAYRSSIKPTVSSASISKLKAAKILYERSRLPRYPLLE